MTKRILALLLAVCMLAGVMAGCNKTNADPSKPDSSDSNNGGGTQKPDSQTSDATKQTSAKYVYTTDYVNLTLELAEDESLNYLNTLCVSGNYLYVTADISKGVPGGTEGGDDDMGIAPLDDGFEANAEGGDMTLVGGEEAPIEMPVVGDEVASQPADTETDGEEPATEEPAEEPAPDEPTIEPSDPGEWYTSETRLYQVDLATGVATQFAGYTTPEIPEGYQGYTNINQILTGADGTIWIYDTMNCYHYNLPEDFDPETENEWDYYEDGPSTYRLQLYGADGTLKQTIDLSPEDGDGSGNSKNFAFVDGKSQLYFYDWNTNEVTIENADGKILKTLEVGDNGGNISNFCGKAALQSYTDTGAELRLIDPDTFELSDPIETPANAWTFLASYDEAYDYYFLLNGDIYGYKQKEQVSEQVVSWMDCDINSDNIWGTYALEDGRILGILNESGNGMMLDGAISGVARAEAATNAASGYSLVFLTKTDAANVKPKTVLTMACMNVPWELKSRIVEFNKSSGDYRIIIKDYSQYATNDDYYAGLTKLNTEIISGQIPDIFYTANMPITQYAGQGILEDLRPYIDKDSELSGDALMTHVLDAASMDGHLYQAFSAFSIQTAIGLTKIVGDYDEWTLANIKDAMTKLQPEATVFDVYYTRDSMLQNCLSRSYSSFVNRVTGECNFDGQDFRDLLEFINSFPVDYDYSNYDYNKNPGGAESMKRGLQLLMDAGVSSLDSFLYTLASFGGEEVSYVGYPSTTGNNNVFSLYDGLCISSTCADKDGAWQFVRTLFTKEYQEENSYYGLPTNAAVFNEQIKNLMTIEYQTDADGNPLLDENGEKLVNPKASYWFDENNQYTIDVMTQEQLDQIMALYSSTELVIQNDEEVMNIIKGETEAYFAGSKTLDDTVRLIQNRVSLYVAEQK